MLQQITCFLATLLLFTANLSGDNISAPPTLKILNLFYPFEGDSYGQFRSNLVATLSDGSSWKIHPLDHDKMRYWKINDTVHVGVRTLFYFFKREHKFELVNHSREETARVMLVDYPDFPITIIKSIEYPKYSFFDGKLTLFYRKYLLLSDGTICKILDDCKFKEGDLVYIGFNISGDYHNFVITGLEREATWTWVIGE